MRKIDPRDFKRFMRAMELMARELNRLKGKETAGEIVWHGRELERAYRRYRHSVERLEEDVAFYFDTFDRAHEQYRLASRKRSKLRRKARNAARNVTKKLEEDQQEKAEKKGRQRA